MSCLILWSIRGAYWCPPPLHSRIGGCSFFFGYSHFEGEFCCSFTAEDRSSKRKIQKSVRQTVNSLLWNAGLFLRFYGVSGVCVLQSWVQSFPHIFFEFFFLEMVFASEIATKFCYKMRLVENNSIYRFGCGGGFMLLMHPVYPSIPIIKLGALFPPYLFLIFFSSNGLRHWNCNEILLQNDCSQKELHLPIRLWRGAGCINMPHGIK